MYILLFWSTLWRWNTGKKCSGIIDVPLIYGCWYNREVPVKKFQKTDLLTKVNILFSLPLIYFYSKERNSSCKPSNHFIWWSILIQFDFLHTINVFKTNELKHYKTLYFLKLCPTFVSSVCLQTSNFSLRTI